MEEIWKEIEGYSGKYQISNKGNIRSFSRWKNGDFLKFGTCGKPGPYYHLTLVNGSRKEAKQYYVHRLVAQHFIPNPYNLPEVNHIDGNTLNNCVDNLEWCTRAYNAKHASTAGLLSDKQRMGKDHPNSKKVKQMTIDGAIVKIWDSVNQVGRETSYGTSNIFNCCKHRTHTAYGFRWEYADGEANNNNTEKSPKNES